MLADPMFYSKQAWVGQYFERGGGLDGGGEKPLRQNTLKNNPQGEVDVAGHQTDYRTSDARASKNDSFLLEEPQEYGKSGRAKVPEPLLG